MNTPLGAAIIEPAPHEPPLVEQQLQKSLEHFRVLIEHSSDLISVLTPDGIICYVSPSSKRVLGYAQEKWVGVNLFAYVHPEDECAVRTAFLSALKEIGGAHRGEFRFLHQDGSWRVMEAITTGSYNEGGKLGIVMNARDISERVAQTAALRYQALHDALTDLPNRTLFRESLQQAILHAQRYKKPLALLLLDLDRFRDINDTFGHHWGDALLQQVGERLRSALRKSDPISRLGGDEFAVLLPNTGDVSGATRTATRIIGVLERPFIIEGHTLNVGADMTSAVKRGSAGSF